MDPRMVAMGGLVLSASSLTLIGIGALASPTPLALAAGGFLAVAVGSLAVDRVRHGRPA